MARTAVKEAAIKRVRGKLGRSKSPLNYQRFRELLGKEAGMTEAQVLGAIKIFRNDEGLPEDSRYHLFRKFEMSEKERCCFVRNPTEEELVDLASTSDDSPQAAASA